MLAQGYPKAPASMRDGGVLANMAAFAEPWFMATCTASGRSTENMHSERAKILLCSNIWHFRYRNAGKKEAGRSIRGATGLNAGPKEEEENTAEPILPKKILRCNIDIVSSIKPNCLPYSKGFP